MVKGKFDSGFDWYVFDMDGTLTDNRWREYMVPFDSDYQRLSEDEIEAKWRIFHMAAGNDRPNKQLIKYAKKVAKDANILILTARPDYAYEVTKKWLKKYGVPFDAIIMRNEGEYDTHNYVWKPIELRKFIKNKLDAVVEMWDDDERILDAMEKIGVTPKYPGSF